MLNVQHLFTEAASFTDAFQYKIAPKVRINMKVQENPESTCPFSSSSADTDCQIPSHATQACTGDTKVVEHHSVRLSNPAFPNVSIFHQEIWVGLGENTCSEQTPSY